jgi:hypothetical protein
MGVSLARARLYVSIVVESDSEVPLVKIELALGRWKVGFEDKRSYESGQFGLWPEARLGT